MDEPSERNPRYCPRVSWGMDRLDLRYPTHGTDECRAIGRGVEVHACRRRAGHGEDLIAHVCYCGQSWVDEVPVAADDDGADAKNASGATAPPESDPESEALG